MPMSRKSFVTALVVTALVAAGVAAAVVDVTRGGSTHTVTVLEQQSTPVSNVGSTELTVADIAQRFTKSVVEVVATDPASQQTSPYPYGSSSTSEAEGTGWVYDAQGDIVTNEHVIDGASSVKVNFPDGSSAKATIVGSDISTDLAVLKVDAPRSELQPLTIGNSSNVQVGDGVVAIGDPFGLTGTVTSGIVSAVDREIQAPDETPIEGAIQTDAAINHGNSGGPLFDMQGQVIGITSQIESDSGGNDGVGFAIPSNTITFIVPQLIAKGAVKHAFLGVEPTSVKGGVGITQVQSGTAAATAGLKVGDVITKVDGKAVANADALRATIDRYKPGDTVTLTVRTKAGATRSIRVTLGTRPASQAQQ
jgi:putative serine protease PepD